VERFTLSIEHCAAILNFEVLFIKPNQSPVPNEDRVDSLKTQPAFATFALNDGE
jgi:hypothetical protein